jgi:hypothetical protein
MLKKVLKTEWARRG